MKRNRHGNTTLRRRLERDHHRRSNPNLVQPATAPAVSWWLDAPADGFTERARELVNGGGTRRPVTPVKFTW